LIAALFKDVSNVLNAIQWLLSTQHIMNACTPFWLVYFSILDHDCNYTSLINKLKPQN